jgi:aquaporin Z
MTVSPEKAMLVEFLGSLFFFSIILHVVSDPSINIVAIPIGLLAAIYFGGSISGGHFNPAVSLMMLLKEKISAITFMLYIIAQVMGAITAILINAFLF